MFFLMKVLRYFRNYQAHQKKSWRYEKSFFLQNGIFSYLGSQCRSSIFFFVVETSRRNFTAMVSYHSSKISNHMYIFIPWSFVFIPCNVFHTHRTISYRGHFFHTIADFFILWASVVKYFYYNVTSKAPPTRKYYEATRIQVPRNNHSPLTPLRRRHRDDRQDSVSYASFFSYCFSYHGPFFMLLCFFHTQLLQFLPFDSVFMPQNFIISYQMRSVSHPKQLYSNPNLNNS